MGRTAALDFKVSSSERSEVRQKMAARCESHVRFSCGVFAMVILVAVLRVCPVAAQISEMERGDDTSHRSSNNLVKLPWRKAKLAIDTLQNESVMEQSDVKAVSVSDGLGIFDAFFCKLVDDSCQ